jgi:hypothetical protein
MAEVMAQYNKRNNSFLPHGTSLFEVVMLADQEGNISTGGGNFSGSAVDAFGRARMSEPLTLFDANNVGALSTELYNITSGTGAVAHNANDSSAEMSISAASDSVIRRSRRRMAYQPGKSLLVLATFTMAAPEEHLTQRVGYYDNSDGIFLEEVNGTYNIVLRSSSSGSVVETRVPQSQWNGDKINGIPEDSTSGHILDLEKSQIFWADFEWLGVGTVRCGFVINGELIVVHSFHHANIITGTYMKSAQLPVSYEITAGASYAGSGATMKQICTSVASEGGYEAIGQESIAGTSLAGNGTNTTNVFVNLVTVRLADLNTIAVITGLDVLNIANADFEWGLFRNATIAGMTFPNTVDGIQYDTTGADLTNIGTRVAGGFLGGKTAPASFGSSNWDYQIGLTNASTSDTFTLAVRATTTSKAAAGIIKWIKY